jgi:hypothetical protein
MVKAMIDISEHANRLLNMVKAKHGLKTKSQAIEKMAQEYERAVLGLAQVPHEDGRGAYR